MSICNSVYEEYDPYDFIYTGSGNNSLSDPIYATVNKPDNTPMSPGLSRMSTIDRRSFKCVKVRHKQRSLCFQTNFFL